MRKIFYLITGKVYVLALLFLLVGCVSVGYFNNKAEILNIYMPQNSPELLATKDENITIKIWEQSCTPLFKRVGIINGVAFHWSEYPSKYNIYQFRYKKDLEEINKNTGIEFIPYSGYQDGYFSFQSLKKNNYFIVGDPLEPSSIEKLTERFWQNKEIPQSKTPEELQVVAIQAALKEYDPDPSFSNPEDFKLFIKEFISYHNLDGLILFDSVTIDTGMILVIPTVGYSSYGLNGILLDGQTSTPIAQFYYDGGTSQEIGHIFNITEQKNDIQLAVRTDHKAIKAFGDAIKEMNHNNKSPCR